MSASVSRRIVSVVGTALLVVLAALLWVGPQRALADDLGITGGSEFVATVSDGADAVPADASTSSEDIADTAAPLASSPIASEGESSLSSGPTGIAVVLVAGLGIAAVLAVLFAGIGRHHRP